MTKLSMVVLAVVMAAACGDQQKPKLVADAPPMADSATLSPVERGRYIMNTVAACTFCHTPLNPDGSRDLTRLFAGVDCLIDIPPCLLSNTCGGPPPPPDPNDGFGCISSRNLTNDPTGLKNATDEEIKNAFRNGHRTDGKTLAPVMPYYIFHNMSDADADAVVAYMRTIPGVSHTVPPNEEPWLDMNNGGDATLVQYITDDQIPVARFGGPSADRGRYLAAKIGLCVDCHTPDNPAIFPQPLVMSQAFTGGRQFTKQQLGLLDASYPEFITTRNLTPDATGLMGWTKDQIENVLAKGKDQNGNAVCAATHGSVNSTYAALAKQDLDDIADYLIGLPPVANDTGSNCQGPPVP